MNTKYQILFGIEIIRISNTNTTIRSNYSNSIQIPNCSSHPALTSKHLYLTDPVLTGQHRVCYMNTCVNKSVSHPLWKYVQDTFTTKPEKLGSWNFERRFTFPHYHMSCVTDHVSHVMCHVSHVMNFFFLLLFFGHSGEASWWRVFYQRGLPHLVLKSE